MDSKEKSKIAFRMIARAETGLMFLERFLTNCRGTDTAWSRSLYILLSYSFELILKSALVLSGTFATLEDLKEKLRKLSHNIKKISNELGSAELSRIGIKNIEPNTTKSFLGYVVETKNDRKIRIEDFINVRYDFTSDDIRGPRKDESEEIRKDIQVMWDFLREIKKGLVLA